MAAEKTQKLSQAEMLEKLAPPPFRQSPALHPDAEIQHSPEERWWRSDSPRADEHPDLPKAGLDGSATQGVLGHGYRAGPGQFHSASQTACGIGALIKGEEGLPATIPGYSGHIAGKVAGNVIGGSYQKANEDSVEHLKTTSQVVKYSGGAV